MRGLHFGDHGADFFFCAYDYRRQNPDGVFGHGFVNENRAAVTFFAFERNAHFGEGFAGTVGARDPDLRRHSLAVNFRGLESARGHATAEDDDGVGMIERIFDDQPAADSAENPEARDGEDEQRRKGEPGFGLARLAEFGAMNASQ